MNKWFVSIKERGKDLFNLEGLEEIKTKDDVYYADPFLLEDYLFFEDFDHKKGVISCMDLKTKEVTKILEEDFHLSYPCVFKEGDDYYMIPEMGSVQKIILYKAKKFPFKWEPVSLIKDNIVTADPQIFKHAGKWFLFVTHGCDNYLEIFKADNLLGEWTLHCRKEEMHSRSAGNIFEYEGKLLRPVQKNDKIYGGAILFKEFSMTDSSIQEKEWGRIEPNWAPNLIGTHTFNFNDKYVVIDGKITL